MENIKYQITDIKCAWFASNENDILLKCNYKPRELLKFFLETDNQCSDINCVLWMKNGLVIETGIASVSKGSIKIPKELQG